MTLAIVIVFPEPVTPSSVWKRSPRSRPRDSSAIALRLIAGGLERSLEVEFGARHARNITIRRRDLFGLEPRSASSTAPRATRPSTLALYSGVSRSRRATLGDPFHPPRGPHDLLQVGEVLDLDEHGAGDPSRRPLRSSMLLMSVPVALTAAATSA